MKYKIDIPIYKKMIKKLKVGDVVYLSGRIFTLRDMAHKKISEWLKKEERIPFNLKYGCIFHAGPIIRGCGNKFEMISIGSTTSARMNRYEPNLIEKLKIRGIIGKGGMDEEVGKALKRFGCVYFSWPGGCAALAAQYVKVKKIYWKDLGVVEGVWELEAEEFGPLIVAMDAHGGNLYRRKNAY